MLDYWISGEAAPAELHLTLFDLYGGRLPQKSVRFDGRNRQGRVELQLPPKRSLGQFRIEAVLMRAGKPVSPVSELILTRIDRPRYFDKEAPADSPFGIHVNPYDLGLTAVKAAGCTWVRTHDAGMPYIGWAYLEKEPGKWSFYDAELMMYRKYGFRILGGIRDLSSLGEQLLPEQSERSGAQTALRAVRPEGLCQLRADCGIPL